MTNEKIGLHVGNALAYIGTAKDTIKQSNTIENQILSKCNAELDCAIDELNKIYEKYVKHDPLK